MRACTTCGACCASFRVDFAVQETQDEGGAVPMGMCDAITTSTARMRGTDYASPRCAALTGTIGSKVACGIYEWRPSPCDELQEGSEACIRARMRHGLAPLMHSS